jgi:drug/metabolite transporter (DMT)-like permease
MTSDRTLAAAGLILIYAVLIGFTDNFVRVIAAEAGLWQFHLFRSVLAMAILALVGVLVGLRLRPRNLRAVAARSAIHGAAMMIYFGALAFLPVALVAAGLFTAPIFVLLISHFAFGQHIGPVRIAAVGVGFVGVLLVLGPEAVSGASLAAVLPVAAGAMYALGNIATRRWCAGESAGTLLGGFFVALGVIGALGMILLTLWPLPVPEGTDGFLHRGPVLPSGTFWFWTFVQAAGSLLGVGLMIRAYQIADAGRVSVFEYVILPASALWGYVLWGERLGLVAILGMGLIAAAGIMIAARARSEPDTSEPDTSEPDISEAGASEPAASGSGASGGPAG